MERFAPPDGGECPFCLLVRGQAAARVIFRTGQAICFIPERPQVPGHAVIASVAHVENLFDSPTEVLHAVASAIQQFARLALERIGATGVNCLHASGASAQQSVGHLHFHVLPRFPGDGVNAWPALSATPFEADAIYERLLVKTKDE